MPQRACSAFPCHCGGREAKYIITYPSGSEGPVSNWCANMYVAAGYPCRPLPSVKIPAGQLEGEEEPLF